MLSLVDMFRWAQWCRYDYVGVLKWQIRYCMFYPSCPTWFLSCKQRLYLVHHRISAGFIDGLTHIICSNLHLSHAACMCMQ
jgi:hypothetical protein